ncbi:MAG: cytochrome c oxidase subunit II [Verrucomicrobiota bacterium]
MNPLAFFSITEFLGQSEAASEHAGMIDHMNEIVHWFMLILFVGWTAFFFYVLFRFHQKRNPKASYKGVTSHFSTHLEVLVVLVEVVLLLGFAFPLWAQRVDSIPDVDDPNVVRIRAVGEQYRWNFHYAGADGRFGLIRPEAISGANPVGLVKEDPNAADDFLSNELLLPKGKTVVVQVTSKDVIHGLHLPPMRIQQDAIPGMEIPMWFVPSKTGEWDIVCAQLCGAGHAKMVGQMKCIKASEFDEWFGKRSASAAKMNVAALH